MVAVFCPYWVQIVKLTIYGTKNGNLEGLCLTFSEINKGGIWEFYLSPRANGGFFLTINHFLEQKEWRGFLIALAWEQRAVIKFNFVH